MTKSQEERIRFYIEQCKEEQFSSESCLMTIQDISRILKEEPTPNQQG